MSRSCAEWRGDIGAYIVGALDDRAGVRVSHHLAECHGCRADYDELVQVRAWLGRLAPAARQPEPGRAGQPGRPPLASLPQNPHPETRPDATPRSRARQPSGTR